MESKGNNILSLQKGTALMLTVTNKAGLMEFPTLVKEVLSTGVLLEPIKHNDKTVNFSAENLHIRVRTSSQHNKPMEWVNCKVSLVSHKGITYHFLQTSSEGKEVNRRESFRVNLSLAGKAQIKEHCGVSDVIVHDISASGFSVIVSGVNAEVGDTCTAQFNDKSTGNNLKLTGKIVRTQLLRDDRVLYGCRFMKRDVPGISEYVARKQLQHRKQK